MNANLQPISLVRPRTGRRPRSQSRAKEWFAVDRGGLRKLLEGRTKSRVVFELVSNAWDSGATRCDVVLQPIEGVAKALLTVEDDAPDGFADMRHAWTLYAESSRKADPEKRGRFNLGDKLVLALCEDATIVSTRSAVRFDAKGRSLLRMRRDSGSIFSARLTMTRAELEAALSMLATLIPPIPTTINGTLLESPTRVASVNAELATEIADGEGVLRRSRRKTEIVIYQPRPGEPAQLYELGVPVLETGDRFSVDVRQKVPLNADRDNVPQAFLQDVRTLALNATAELLEPEDVTAPWVRNALEDPRIEARSVETVLTKQYGERRVIADPSDPEATKIAMAQGYTVIAGRAFSAEAWANVRASGAALPAGRVTPSPKPFSAGGAPLERIPESAWTTRQRAFVELAQWLGRRVTGGDIAVELASDPRWPFRGCFGARRLIMNVTALDLADTDCVNEFLIHEFAHHFSSDHLSKEYHDALCRVGARVARAFAEHPQRFR